MIINKFKFITFKDIRIGSEIKINNSFSLRSGLYESNYSIGIGLELKNINFDYTFLDNAPNVFGNNHIIGFIVKLDKF